MSKITTLRGMNDLPPEEVRVWNLAEEAIQKVFNSYGYEEIRFPIVEKTELFTRSNESADVVTKEMYTFEDKGGDSISLRPEGTAGCVRAAIDNALIRVDSPRLGIKALCLGKKDLKKEDLDNFSNQVLKCLELDRPRLMPN